MRVLILGAAGMLGHKLCQMYRDRFEVWATVRSDHQELVSNGLIEAKRLIGGVDGFDFDSVVGAVATVEPDVVINCIGIIKQLATAHDPIISLTINSLFPHRLARLCVAARTRLIHVSTDCVFSGRKGMYTEADVSDAEDLYGRTKYLGEVGGPRSLTLRTSIIGRELKTRSGLVEWFLGNAGGTVRGFTRAIYSGFTTQALARIIADVLEHHPDLNGVYQVSSEPINKYDLLRMVRNAYGIDVEIEPDEAVRIDRSLDSNRFRAATGFVPPTWTDMIHELAQDRTPYEQWRNTRAA